MIGFAPLLQLPLFMGMARDDLQQIVAHTKFDFFKRPADSKVISEGDRCEAVVILTHGSLSVEKQSDDHGYGVREIVNAPLVIQLEHLFGLTQRYSASFTTLSPCNFMSITKPEVMFLFEQFDVFRINYLRKPSRAFGIPPSPTFALASSISLSPTAPFPQALRSSPSS